MRTRFAAHLLLLLVPLIAACSDRQAQPDKPPSTAAAEPIAVAPPTADPVTTIPAVVADAAPDAGTLPAPETVVPVRTPEEAARIIREPDVIYVPTPQPVVEAMLAMAAVKPGDVLYDLGSGDGRIPITAARRYGVRGTGIDIDPARFQEANRNASEAGVAGLVTFKQQDLFESDFSEASVVTLYLLDTLNERLRPKLLRELRPGTRIVSHAFRMGPWQPERTQQVDGRTIYLWTVPPREGVAARAVGGG